MIFIQKISSMMGLVAVVVVMMMISRYRQHDITIKGICRSWKKIVKSLDDGSASQTSNMSRNVKMRAKTSKIKPKHLSAGQNDRIQAKMSKVVLVISIVSVNSVVWSCRSFRSFPSFPSFPSFRSFRSFRSTTMNNHLGNWVYQNSLFLFRGSS